ncbi:MAG: MFS transporter [Steroidobacterales bacterium]
MPLTMMTRAWPLLLGMGVLMLGAGLQSTLLGIRATAEAFPTMVTGLVMASYYAGYLLGTIATPRLIRNVGHVRVFAAFAAVAAAANLIQAGFVSPVPWAAMRLVTGLCFAGIYVVAESWLNGLATRTNRSRLLAAYMIVLYVGLGAAQFLLILSNTGTAAPFMLASGLICVAVVPTLLSAQIDPEVVVSRAVPIRDIYRLSPLGVAAVVVAGVISSIIFSIGPVYARLAGQDTTAIATFMAVNIFAGVATQYPVGALADRFDRRAVIAGVCVLATAAGAALVVFPTLPQAGFLALSATFSGLTLTIYSLGISHVNDRLEPAQMVAASGALLLLDGAGAIVGPVLVTSLMSSYGASAYFATLASLSGVLTLHCLWRRSRRAAVPVTQKGPFIRAQPQPCASVTEPPWLGPSK